MADTILNSTQAREEYSISQFHIPELANAMQKVRNIIDRGPGFAVLHTLPINKIGREAATTIFWLLGKII